MAAVVVHPEVRDALAADRAVVALETAVLTHGLPSVTPPSLGMRADFPGWDHACPLNLETVRSMQRVVREHGAVPATIGVIDGTLRVGLEDEEIERLATDDGVAKASAGNLADVIARGRVLAGTTVSATLLGCAPSPRPIRLLATGGIGGVHAGWTRRPDISADLVQLRHARVCVVCSGAKSILDLPATLEALETLGIPVAGYGTDRFPRFQAEGRPDLLVRVRVDGPDDAGRLCRAQWGALGLDTAIVVAVPVPAGCGLTDTDLETAVTAAEGRADAAGIDGAARTPYLLAEVARLTEGRSLRANVALLRNNAMIAAAVARDLATHIP